MDHRSRPLRTSPCIRAGLFAFVALASTNAPALSANKVWFEVRPETYRVVVEYTVPALREFREAHVDFTDIKKAGDFYWQLVRGADFYLPLTEKTVFQKDPPQPQPW